MNALLTRDEHLIQIVDAATARSQAASGDWLACRPGCTQCCYGVFAISQLDALRLQAGLDELARTDPMRASAVMNRARQVVSRLAPQFPGDTSTGILAEDDPDFEARFEAFANDEPCPALDPQSGLCDLYAARPMTCRTFGPPLETEGGYAVCDLCFVDAPEDEVARCAVSLDESSRVEEALTTATEQITGRHGFTIIAYALLQDLPDAA